MQTVRQQAAKDRPIQANMGHLLVNWSASSFYQEMRAVSKLHDRGTGRFSVYLRGAGDAYDTAN
jgi:hypothetical protein